MHPLPKLIIPTLALVLAGAAPALAAETTRVSVSSQGAQTDGRSGLEPTSLSRSGRFAAFSSEASNLVAGDANGASDVFLRDRSGGTTRRVSGEAGAYAPAISADGRRIAYAVPGGLRIHDRRTGRTRTIRIGRRGVPAKQIVLVGHDLSANGRVVVFATARRRPTETRGYALYRHRVREGRTRRVSPFVIDLRDVSVSRTGRHVAFATAGFTNRFGDRDALAGVLVRDLRTGRTVRADRSSEGRSANRLGFDPEIADGGRYVTFASDATNLVRGSGRRQARVYVHHLSSGQTTLVSPREPAVTTAGAPAISADGRRIAFQLTPGSGAIADAEGPIGEVHLHDRATGATTLVSVTRSGAPSLRSGFPALGGRGTVVGFTSAGADLVEGDTNGVADVFARGPFELG
jgi:Tol biopolymer transport system component